MTTITTAQRERANEPAYTESIWIGSYVVFTLFVCFVFSYIDRQIVSILVQPIKQSLSLTDTQIGMLQGVAFTLCYATMGVFVAKLVDRSNRVRLIAACVAIWAISTAMCGTAHSFGELLFWRAGTAVAEAALSPAAISIFSDMFRPRKVTRATSVFMLGPYIGGGVALMGGGLLLGWTESSASQLWLKGLGISAWQLSFFVVGLPGVLLALLVLLTIREPLRRGTETLATDEAPPMRKVIHELWVTHRFIVPYFLGYVALITLFYSHSAWFPTLLIRKFELLPSAVGKIAGPAYMLGGIAGVISSGFLVGRVRDDQALRRVLVIAAGAATVLIPAAFAAPLVNELWLALVLYGTCAFAASIVMALAPVPVQIALPNRMRGRAIALLVFLTNAISGSIGPFLVGWINDALKSPATGLSWALSGVGGFAALLSAFLYWTASARVISTVDKGLK